MALRHVLSVCAGKDIKVWQAVAPRLLEFVPARDHKVIVPDEEMADFRAVTPSAIEVEAESGYLKGWSLPMLRTLMPPGRENRAGWYLQQFVKISALMQGQEDNVNLIWDADTMPLRAMEFVRPDGKLVYYRGTDQARQPHADADADPYFTTLKKLLGLNKQVDFSFISQSFPCYVGWVRQMVADIEAAHGAPWVEAILASADLSKLSAFSEYETLGNYVTATHPDEIVIVEREWEHFGSVFIGVENMTAARRARFAQAFDFIAFEHWQLTPGFRASLDGFGKFFFTGPWVKNLVIWGGESIADFPFWLYLISRQPDLVHGVVRTGDAREQAKLKDSLNFAPHLAVERGGMSAALGDLMAADLCETGLVLITHPDHVAAFHQALPRPVDIRPDTPLPSYILLPYPPAAASENLWRECAENLSHLGYRLVLCDRMCLFIRFAAEGLMP